ncbi:molybdate ABC transporter substrate-binding protein [Desulfocurvibacter africanus]|uniref:Molybdenum ABC transporter, periplasmic molybdate-binding protein n=1 Tax=Desulfocurvibacter africanus subsp. africanus str. Walvis Bay TaxID=690850 RepID=F3Z235_DESAF|nr:molybdate ABC transporter substrate-binding protein [Desulfocurvibacter africanus]EGJ51244.1 molybdenum ABC transporter, periplasmic molybdate-binding protein [Desulfocurvibacter africanus subsp. africanus str. Walvis Bay]
MIRSLLFVLTLALMLPGITHAQTLTIAAGAGYKKLVEEFASSFEAASEFQIERIYGNMGQVTAQAKASGLIDMVIGDLAFLNGTDMVMSSFTDIGRGRLVLAWAKGVELRGPEDLKNPAIRRIAMPDSQKAIYGKAGSEFLKNSGLLATVKDRLITVGSVPQVSAYIVSNEVDAGFINLTDALGIEGKIGGYMEMSESLYSPIRIVAATLASAPHADAAREFAAFLSTKQASDVAAHHGL